MRTIVEKSILPIAKFWYFDHWINFNLHIGEFKNIKDFLSSNNISFLSDMKLNFDKIPIEFHTNRKINTLNDYLSYNHDNNLTINFLHYFIKSILDVRYDSDEKLVFRISNGRTWQNAKIISTHPSYQNINNETSNTSQLYKGIKLSQTNNKGISNTTTSTASTTSINTTTRTKMMITSTIVDKPITSVSIYDNINIKTLFIHIPNEKYSI